MGSIYNDEHKKCQIDLTFAEWSTAGLHDLYKTIGNELSDVDWIAETSDEVFLIEYKNTNFVGKTGKNEFYMKLWKKYYGSMFFMLAQKNTKPVNFICIVESEVMDSVLRKKATASIKRRLPFSLQENPSIIVPLINNFKILTIAEWNTQYPQFLLSRLP